MGLDAWYEVVSRSEFAKRNQASEESDSERESVQYELFRDWWELDAVFIQMDKPLNLVIRGNRPTITDFDEEWGGAYEAYTTPAIVKKIDRALGSVSSKQFVLQLKAVRKARAQKFPADIRSKMASLRSHEAKYFISALTTIKAAYRAAAKKNAYLRIFIC
jgi:hypothetical protein